jgi:pantoate--beta-alanine ligase
LSKAATKIRAGGNPQAAARNARRSLTALGFKVDYVEVRNAETLGVPASDGEPLRLLTAAWLGKTRLIDNVPISRPADSEAPQELRGNAP